MELKKQKPPITIANISNLAGLYGISRPTMRRWLKKAGIGKPSVGKIYNANELRKIVEILGEP